MLLTFLKFLPPLGNIFDNDSYCIPSEFESTITSMSMKFSICLNLSIFD